MAFDVMGVVERKVLGPFTRLGQLEDSPQERRIICHPFQRRDLHGGTLRQLDLRRQHYHPVFDCAFVAHTEYLPETDPASKALLAPPTL